MLDLQFYQQQVEQVNKRKETKNNKTSRTFTHSFIIYVSIIKTTIRVSERKITHTHTNIPLIKFQLRSMTKGNKHHKKEKYEKLPKSTHYTQTFTMKRAPKNT